MGSGGSSSRIPQDKYDVERTGTFELKLVRQIDVTNSVFCRTRFGPFAWCSSFATSYRRLILSIFNTFQGLFSVAATNNLIFFFGFIPPQNLDGNFLHDEGVEQIGRAISMNKKTALQKLFVGWNGVGDDGAAALAKMIEKNGTVEVLGLSENDITNTGANSLLSSLSINTSVSEISGLVRFD